MKKYEKDLFRKSVYGVGYLGVGEYLPREDGKLNKCYRTWFSMFNRCYGTKRLQDKPTYKDCFVDERWHNFQNFAEWFYKNYTFEYMQDWQLDKDILVKGNRVYSPETCSFVPKEINLCFSYKRKKHMYDCPIGVTKHKRSKDFVAQINVGDKRLRFYGFNTPEQAYLKYKEEKEKYIKILADKYKNKITDICYKAMYNYNL